MLLKLEYFESQRALLIITLGQQVQTKTVPGTLGQTVTLHITRS